MLYRTHASEELDRMLDFIPNVLVLDRSAERAEREIAMFGYGVRQVVIWVGCGKTFPDRLGSVERARGDLILPSHCNLQQYWINANGFTGLIVTNTEKRHSTRNELRCSMWTSDHDLIFLVRNSVSSVSMSQRFLPLTPVCNSVAPSCRAQ